ncbi:MAG: T9SS type A sorting domain-containing protein [Bernardetiaceae bacterium]|nr:T9SS type A sorting domain-containing protein [Bernardetiaceae bacterium]
MKKNILLLTLVFLGIFFTYQVKAQITNTNANIVILPDTRVLANQYVDNNAAGNIDLRGTLEVRENVINDGVLEGADNSLLLLSGAAMQFVQGSSTIRLWNMQLDNGANHATLENIVRIRNSLLLTDGILYTSDAAPVRFTTTANNPAENNANHIHGTAIMEQRNIGAAAFPLFLNLSMNAGDNIGNVTLERRTGTNGIIVIGANESIATYWTIDNTVGGETAERTMNFSWLSVFDNAKDLTQMQLWRTVAFNTTTAPWTFRTPVQPIPRTWTQPNENMLRNSWTFSDIINPLPVEWKNFEVEQVAQDAHLKWKTAQERLSDHFIVERSLDGKEFQALGKVDAEGESSRVVAYEFLDKQITQLESSVLYYRLRQVDTDGTESLSDTKVLYVNGSENMLTVKAVPNPFSDRLVLQVQTPKQNKNLQITIFDVQGRKLLQKQYGTELRSIDISETFKSLAKGMYLIEVHTDRETKQLKVVKE